MTEYKEAKSGEVIKLEKEGDSVEGIYQGYEESKKYKDSFALSIKQGEEVKVLFVNNIVTDMIDRNAIKQGQEIKIEFLGKKKTEDGSKEYNNFKVLYK